MNSLTSTIIVSVFYAVTVAYGDDPKNEVAIVDNPADDYLVICGPEFDRDDGGYSTCAIDLNEDGRDDQVFANAATSGTGGEAATIYLSREHGRFTRIGTILHQALATERIRTGGQLLHCASNGGGGHFSINTYLLSHDGLKEIMELSGEWQNAEYAKLFNTVFAEPLKPEYRFVAARLKSKADHAGSGQPATRPESKSEGGGKPHPESEGRSR